MEKTEKFEGKFEFLEHTADVYISAHGATMEEAFGNATLAMFEVMTDTEKIAPGHREAVEVEAEDEYALLYSWLEALLVKFEVNGMVYSKFEVHQIKETNPLLNYYKAKEVPVIAHTADALEMPPENVVEYIISELKKLKLA